MSQDLRYLQNITIIDDLEQLYEDKNEEAGQNSNAKIFRNDSMQKWFSSEYLKSIIYNRKFEEEEFYDLSFLPLYHPEILTLGSITVQSQPIKKCLVLYDFLSTYDLIFDNVKYLSWNEIQEFYTYLRMFSHLNSVFVHVKDLQDYLNEAKVKDIKCNYLYYDDNTDLDLRVNKNYVPQISTIGGLGDEIMMSNVLTIQKFLENVPSTYLLTYRNIDSLILKLKNYMDSLDENNTSRILEVFRSLTKSTNGKVVLHNNFKNLSTWKLKPNLETCLKDANATNLFFFTEDMKSLDNLDFLKLSIGLTYCKEITTFDCQNVEIKDDQINILFECLEQFNELQYLYLKGVPLVGKDGHQRNQSIKNIKRLCKYIKENLVKTLEVLDLGKTGINADELSEIMKAFGKDNVLSTIYLEENDIGEQSGYKAVFEAMMKNCSKLQTMFLDNNKITDKMISELKDVVQKCDHLRSFFVTHNQISPDKVTEINNCEGSKITA